MKANRMAKKATDILILVCSSILLLSMFIWNIYGRWFYIFILLLLFLIIGSAADLVIQFKSREGSKESVLPAKEMAIQQLILLDEQNKPVKSWDITGKTAIVIGKQNEDEEIDVDLEDCEYSALIDPQHAALNFCNNSWYIEDLGAHNGVKIKKVEDGDCYKVLNRPCRVMPGDIIYIANTRLLLT